MTILENLILQSKLTPYAFAQEYKINNIYTVKKNESFNIKRAIAIAKKLNLKLLSFYIEECEVSVYIY